jgi:competence protein ComEC
MSLLVATYVAMAGMSASVTRAAAMCLLIALTWPLFAPSPSAAREPDVENTLGLALLLFLLFWPLSLYEIGLQLSLAAVWGLARLTGPMSAIFERALPGVALVERALFRWTSPLLPPLVAGTLSTPSGPAQRRRSVLLTLGATSLAATLTTAPIAAYHFGELAPVAVFANILAVPIAGLLLYAGLCSSALNLYAPALAPPFGPLAASGAAPLNTVTDWLVEALEAVSRFFAGLIGGHLTVFPPGWGAVALCFAALALAAAWGRHKPGRPFGGHRRVAAALGLALLPLAWGMVLPAGPPRDLVVTFLDVGQGDAALVRLPSGPVILIDGGGSPEGTFDVGERVLLPALRHLRIPRIDLLVLTHPHEDHLGGLVAVVEQYPVGAVLDSGQPAAASVSYQRFLRAIRQRNLRYLRARRRMELRWGDVRLEILHPAERLMTGTRSDLNNNSVVCRLVYGKTRFLFAGDAEAEAEAVLRASGRDLRAEVLKVGHHGSRFSTDDAWVAAVQPSLAVVSCGRDNRFGHPAGPTLVRLRAAGAPVYRTDLDGAVTVRSDGQRVWAESILGRGIHSQ